MNIYEKLKHHKNNVFELILSDADIELDLGYGIIQKFKAEYPQLEELHKLSNEDEQLRMIDKELKGMSIFFVTVSNGADDLCFKIISDSENTDNIKSYGYIYAENYVPIAEMPDLWNTAGVAIDRAAIRYAERVTSPTKYYFNIFTRNVALIESFLIKYLWMLIFALVVFFGVVILWK